MNCLSMAFLIVELSLARPLGWLILAADMTAANFAAIKVDASPG